MKPTSANLPGSPGDNAGDEVEVTLVRHHQALLGLCNQLEELADQLPDVTDHQSCLNLSRSILPLIKRAHEFEEHTVFPGLADAAKREPGLGKSIQRLHFEHWEDESYAEELCDALHEFAIGSQEANPESLSYMLRGFFEGLRRHIAFETEHLLPILRTV